MIFGDRYHDLKQIKQWEEEMEKVNKNSLSLFARS